VFLGIIVRMLYREREPIHSHAEYQGQEGKFNLEDSAPTHPAVGGASSAGTGGQLEEDESGPSTGEDRAVDVRCP